MNTVGMMQLVYAYFFEITFSLALSAMNVFSPPTANRIFSFRSAP
jgi:hypothetical protein